ncbi:MAG: hypothetical protein O2800_07435 [Planctomycetota bacterium]|nr:hypothetical protein [Planctomycetota bacterium]
MKSLPAPSSLSHAATKEQLREAIAMREGRTTLHGDAHDVPAERVPTGWPAVDTLFGGGLPLRGLHEWAIESPRSPCSAFAPLGVLVHLAWRMDAWCQNRSTATPAHARMIVWIGAWCWPHADTLALGLRHPFRELEQPSVDNDSMKDLGETSNLWKRSIFVRATSMIDRVWCAETALEDPSVMTIVLDARDLDLTASRRLHLAVRRDGLEPTMLLGARTLRELREPSAAITRWRVSPCPIDIHQPLETPRWDISLSRIKSNVAPLGTVGVAGAHDDAPVASMDPSWVWRQGSVPS